VAGTGAAGPGVAAAVAASGVAAPGVAFVDAGAAGRPDVELCPASFGIAGFDPAGHGAVFWPIARVAEIRNDHNHVIFVFNFM
jgi:hypothetical protein